MYHDCNIRQEPQFKFKKVELLKNTYIIITSWLSSLYLHIWPVCIQETWNISHLAKNDATNLFLGTHNCGADGCRIAFYNLKECNECMSVTFFWKLFQSSFLQLHIRIVENMNSGWSYQHWKNISSNWKDIQNEARLFHGFLTVSYSYVIDWMNTFYVTWSLCMAMQKWDFRRLMKLIYNEK